MKGSSPSIEHYLVNFLTSFGIGIQLLRGVGRYFEIHRDCRFFPYERDALKDLPSGWISGALGHYTHQADIDRLHEAGVERVITVSNRSPLTGCLRVGVDDVAVGKMAARYFHKKGFLHVAMGGTIAAAFQTDRERGFREEAHLLGLTYLGSCTDVKEFLSACSGVFPVGLFMVSDSFGVKWMRSLIAEGVDIPRDVSVLGVDNDEMHNPFAPVELSSIGIPADRIAFEACNRLRNPEGWPMLDEIPEPWLFTPSGVVERRSTRVGQMQDPLVRRALVYLQEHLARVQDLDEVAKEVHAHRRTLERHFQNEMGMSLHQWLLRERVEFASRILRETDYTVEVVAELSGFNTRVRLYRAFNQLGRPLPRQIRRGGSDASPPAAEDHDGDSA